MSAVMDGDPGALAELVRRHRGPLLGFFYRMLDGDRALAEDLVQETFVRLLRQRTYAAGRAFKPWLYTVAANLARDHRRAERARLAATGATLLVSLRIGVARAGALVYAAWVLVAVISWRAGTEWSAAPAAGLGLALLGLTLAGAALAWLPAALPRALDRTRRTSTAWHA
jgi:DNA-directed RNA polymerase specialized sigma24 family protein